MHIRLVLYGLLAWSVATLALRLGGQHVLRPGDSARTILVFAVSVLLMAWIIRIACKGLNLRGDEWPAGAVSILLPTLCLDPFSSAFFTTVFPNMSPDVAGAFGGWMLVSCAGGLLGSLIRPKSS